MDVSKILQIFRTRLRIPQFYGPIKRRRKKQMTKTDSRLYHVRINTSNWCVVSLVHIENTSFVSMSASCMKFSFTHQFGHKPAYEQSLLIDT